MSIRSPREMIVEKNFWSRELGEARYSIWTGWRVCLVSWKRAGSDVTDIPFSMKDTAQPGVRLR